MSFADQVTAALRELRVTEQLDLYEPLLRMHITEAFQAAFPDGLAFEDEGRSCVDATREADPQAEDEACEAGMEIFDDVEEML